jgi:uncharacterized membrane protein
MELLSGLKRAAGLVLLQWKSCAASGWMRAEMAVVVLLAKPEMFCMAQNG